MTYIHWDYMLSVICHMNIGCNQSLLHTTYVCSSIVSYDLWWFFCFEHLMVVWSWSFCFLNLIFFSFIWL